MKTRFLFILLHLFGVYSSSLFAQQLKINKDSVKSVIMEREKQFCFELNKFGAKFAFEKYADESAVINRGNDSLIFSKKGIAHFYSKSTYNNAKANWKPDFIDISDDATLAYTYGKYEWIFINDKNEKTTFKGIFHTVWEKNKDGNWYYVWD